MSTTSFAFLVYGNIQSAVLYFWMQSTFYAPRKWAENKKFIVYLIFLLTAIITTACNALQYAPLNFVTTVLSYIIPLYICFKVDNNRGVAYFIFFVIATVITEGLLALSIGLFNSGRGNFKTDYDALTPQIMVLLNLAQIMIALIICKFGNKEKNKQYDKHTLLFMILPILSFAVYFVDLLQVSRDGTAVHDADTFTRIAIAILAVNVFVFAGLEKYTQMMGQKLKLMEETLKLEAQKDYMEIATKSMKEKLEYTENAMANDRIMRHDRRHFEAMLLTLMEDGKTEEVKALLSERLVAEPHSVRSYCDNTTINAVISYYVNDASAKDIDVEISANIPLEIKVDEMDLAITIGNLIENAIHACEKLPEEKRFIKLTAKYKEQLLIQIENSCGEDIVLDEEGNPISEETESGHGVGTKSVIYFVEKVNGQISYSIKDNVFRVRIII